MYPIGGAAGDFRTPRLRARLFISVSQAQHLGFTVESIWICGPKPLPVFGSFRGPQAEEGGGGVSLATPVVPARRPPPERTVVLGMLPGLFPAPGFGETLFPTAGLVGAVIPPALFPVPREPEPAPAGPDDPPEDCAWAAAAPARNAAVTMTKPIRFDISPSCLEVPPGNAAEMDLFPAQCRYVRRSEIADGYRSSRRRHL
jgi:hypothetical protein